MDRRIEVVIAKIENDPTVEFADLALLVNLSSSRLRHLFKKETGVTYKNYLRNLRLRAAEVLLRTTFLSVKEIVTRVGLTHTSHFNREFKRLYGTSPTAFRLRNGLTEKKRKR